VLGFFFARIKTVPNHEREKNIGIAAFLNILFTFIELFGGIWTNSLAILSDALHDLGDSIFLVTSWIAERQARKKPDIRRTFGYQRLSLLAALFSAIALASGSLFILSQAIPRLLNPTPVYAEGMMALAIVGIIFNTAGLWRLKRGHSLNERVLGWHLLEDVLGWGVILVGAVIIRLSGLYILDPLLTLVYSIIIIIGVSRNLKELINILLEGVPAHIELDHVKEGLLKIPGVIGAHDLHVWSLEGETDIFTGHIVVEEKLLQDSDHTRQLIKEELTRHHIEYSTVELESKNFCSGVECRLPQPPRD